MSAPRRDAFGALLDRRGATPERWPAGEREAALELLREDPAARADWQTALDLEAALDDWTVPEPDVDLALRIAAAAPARGSCGEVLALPGLRPWQGAVLATLPVLIGFLIAVVQVEPPQAAASAHRPNAAELELGAVSSYGLRARVGGRTLNAANALPRWLLLALAVSVTLNLVGLGWLVGRGTAGSAPMVREHREFEVRVEGDGAVRLSDLAPRAPAAPRAPNPDGAPAAPTDAPQGLKWIVAALPPERRASMALELHARERPLLEETEKVFVIREEIREELGRTEFEKRRLEEALARLREQLVAIQADSHRILADVAAELSETEREALADRMTASLAERVRLVEEAALAERRDTGEAPVRVYRRHIVLEHESDEEPDPPPE